MWNAIGKMLWSTIKFASLFSISAALLMYDAHVLNCLARWYLPEFGYAVPTFAFAMAFVTVLAARLLRPVFGAVPKNSEDAKNYDTNFRYWFVAASEFCHATITLLIGYLFYLWYFQ